MIVRVRLPAKATSGSANPKLNAASRMWPLDVAKLSPVTVTWVATVTGLNRNGEKPTTWSADYGITQYPVTSPIVIVTSHTRQAVLFSSPPRIARQAQIGYSRPMLVDQAYVPGYCI